MTTLGPLLEVQELDLAADRLHKQRATLPERAGLAESEARGAALDVLRATAQAERDALARAERELSGEVGSIASKAKEVETNLYSGSVTIAKELDGLHQELGLWKQKQEEAEERQLELLEQLDGADAGLAEQQAQRAEVEATCASLAADIAAAEASIDAEIASLGGQAAELRTGLPAPVLAAYDQLRSDPKQAGRAAAVLGDGMCAGCRLVLPVVEYHRMRHEPEDAIVRCVHCSRILVR